MDRQPDFHSGNGSSILPAPTKNFGLVAQLAEHSALNRKVVGSLPTESTKFYSPVAQLVERLTVNQVVVGSTPTWRAIYSEVTDV